MAFDPHHPIVKLCLQGMAFEEKNEREEAARLFLRAWDEAQNDFEKFLGAYYLARQHREPATKLQWLETTLQLALAIDDDTVRSAISALFQAIADCRQALGDLDGARTSREAAASYQYELRDGGPFYHGTRADLRVGDLLKAGYRSNYDAQVVMNHIYFTALVNGAGLAAALARGDGPERVYIVEPTGRFENDPNVTDKKFPGNPTRSYRSREPLRIVAELTEWARLTPEQLAQWRERLAKNTGAQIIN